jgi:hypothetical protein
MNEHRPKIGLALDAASRRASTASTVSDAYRARDIARELYDIRCADDFQSRATAIIARVLRGRS